MYEQVSGDLELGLPIPQLSIFSCHHPSIEGAGTYMQEAMLGMTVLRERELSH